MVRLKAKDWKRFVKWHKYFNSNMVRLKAALNTGEAFAVDIFQFQFGAIKRVFGKELPYLPIEISIPIWCD